MGLRKRRGTRRTEAQVATRRRRPSRMRAAGRPSARTCEASSLSRARALLNAHVGRAENGAMRHKGRLCYRARVQAKSEGEMAFETSTVRWGTCSRVRRRALRPGKPRRMRHHTQAGFRSHAGLDPPAMSVSHCAGKTTPGPLGPPFRPRGPARGTLGVPPSAPPGPPLQEPPRPASSSIYLVRVTVCNPRYPLPPLPVPLTRSALS